MRCFTRFYGFLQNIFAINFVFEYSAIFSYFMPLFYLIILFSQEAGLTHEQINCTNQNERFLRADPKWVLNMGKIDFDM